MADKSRYMLKIWKNPENQSHKIEPCLTLNLNMLFIWYIWKNCKHCDLKELPLVTGLVKRDGDGNRPPYYILNNNKDLMKRLTKGYHNRETKCYANKIVIDESSKKRILTDDKIKNMCTKMGIPYNAFISEDKPGIFGEMDKLREELEKDLLARRNYTAGTAGKQTDYPDPPLMKLLQELYDKMDTTTAPTNVAEEIVYYLRHENAFETETVRKIILSAKPKLSLHEAWNYINKQTDMTEKEYIDLAESHKAYEAMFRIKAIEVNARK